jgi:nicotinate-nucleotide adenylyltransferase
LKKNKKRDYIKIGILGGTFDPPHKGHFYISKVALKKLKLNKILWVITKKNPLKNKPHLKIKERIKLSKEITKKNKKISVKYFDDKIRSNITFNLLNYLKRKTKANLFFLIGADNLKKFHKWKNWKQIPKLAKIVVFPRENYSFSSVATKKLHKRDFIYIKSRKINISSSIIRKFW